MVFRSIHFCFGQFLGNQPLKKENVYEKTKIWKDRDMDCSNTNIVVVLTNTWKQQ